MTYLSFGTNKSDSKREMRCLNVARVALFRSFELGLCWPLAFLTRIRGHFAEVLLPLLHHEMTSFLNFGMHKPTQVMMPAVLEAIELKAAEPVEALRPGWV